MMFSLCARISHVEYGVRHPVWHNKSFTSTTYRAYTSTRHTHTHRLPIITCNNNKRDEENRVRVGFLCTDFIYATISIFDTNKPKEKKIPNEKPNFDSYYILICDLLRPKLS